MGILGTCPKGERIETDRNFDDPPVCRICTTVTDLAVFGPPGIEGDRNEPEANSPTQGERTTMRAGRVRIRIPNKYQFRG